MTGDLRERMSRELAARFPDALISVQVEGNRALIEVEAAEFADLPRVKRQQAVYAVIGEYVTDGTLHAVTIQARVPA